jgi:hypothetical protein
MNKQIQRLAQQAFDVANDGTLSDIKIPKMFIEKFAELIVADCADVFVDRRYMVLNPLEPFADERVRALKTHDKDTVNTIKKHFGVEE